MTDTDTSAQDDNTLSENSDAFFSCRDIHAYYNESYIVQGVSFDIAEREIVALLGRNGAGKTSTLRAIARTDEPCAQGWGNLPARQADSRHGRLPGCPGRDSTGAGGSAHHSRSDR